MKKNLFFVFLFSVLILTNALAEEVVAQPEITSNVVVNGIQGTPLVLREGAEVPVTDGMVLQKGDVLKTPADAKIDVLFNQIAGARLLPSSEAIIKDPAPQDSFFEIKEGNALFNLKKLPEGSTFRVETPTAIAAVRGTQFWGRVDNADVNNSNITFAVVEGSIDIFAKSVNRTYHLAPKQALDIPKYVTASPAVREAKREELKAMKEAAEISTESN